MDREYAKMVAARKAASKAAAKAGIAARRQSPTTAPKSKSASKSPDFYRAMAAAKEMHACPVCGSCRCEKARNPHVTCEQD